MPGSSPGPSPTTTPFATATPFPAPTLLSVSPSSGSAAGGTGVTLAGTNFRVGAIVNIGGVPCNSVNVTSPTQLVCVTGPQAATAAALAVSVTNSDNQTATKGFAFTFLQANSWIPTSTTGVPDARLRHTAVWTGSKMLVWGGSNASGTLGTGGIYDPVTDTWVPITTVGAPTARWFHSAVWTGNKMIVWGGAPGALGDVDAPYLDTGGMYDPVTNSWTAMSRVNAPSARRAHTAVWTGSKMIVWGGVILTGPFEELIISDGAQFDPATNSWSAMNNNGPFSFEHLAHWTETRMLIWGTSGGGNLYNPVADAWTFMAPTSVPAAEPASVWTGFELITWGGRGLSSTYSNIGRRYSIVNNSWTEISTAGAPQGRQGPVSVWSGSKMIVWGGRQPNINTFFDSGGQYDPLTNSWTSTTQAGVPSARHIGSVVWTGTRMIVWGGSTAAGVTNTGGQYTP